MLSKNRSGNIFFTTLLLIFMMLLNGCASLSPREDSVRVNLSNLRMLESTLFEQRFEASIRVQNRSQSQLDVKGLSFDLSLNGKDFASGVSNSHMSIAPLSEGVISVNLTSTLFSLIRQVHSMQEIQNKPFSYELYGKVYTDYDFLGVSFSEKGEIDLTTPAEQTENTPKAQPDSQDF